ncbi:hypothetical protein BJ166DRAFT_577944 [Pestalotiopsis sp. NC0098]|nr:hypothetical protein BJ166DRAFT_577944 [Pestalotiopsis sp. NC0098]
MVMGESAESLHCEIDHLCGISIKTYIFASINLHVNQSAHQSNVYACIKSYSPSQIHSIMSAPTLLEQIQSTCADILGQISNWTTQHDQNVIATYIPAIQSSITDLRKLIRETVRRHNEVIRMQQLLVPRESQVATREKQLETKEKQLDARQAHLNQRQKQVELLYEQNERRSKEALTEMLKQQKELQEEKHSNDLDNVTKELQKFQVEAKTNATKDDLAEAVEERFKLFSSAQKVFMEETVDSLWEKVKPAMEVLEKWWDRTPASKVETTISVDVDKVRAFLRSSPLEERLDGLEQHVLELSDRSIKDIQKAIRQELVSDDSGNIAGAIRKAIHDELVPVQSEKIVGELFKTHRDGLVSAQSGKIAGELLKSIHNELVSAQSAKIAGELLKAIRNELVSAQSAKIAGELLKAIRNELVLDKSDEILQGIQKVQDGLAHGSDGSHRAPTPRSSDPAQMASPTEPSISVTRPRVTSRSMIPQKRAVSDPSPPASTESKRSRGETRENAAPITLVRDSSSSSSSTKSAKTTSIPRVPGQSMIPQRRVVSGPSALTTADAVSPLSPQQERRQKSFNEHVSHLISMYQHVRLCTEDNSPWMEVLSRWSHYLDRRDGSAILYDLLFRRQPIGGDLVGSTFCVMSFIQNRGRLVKRPGLCELCLREKQTKCLQLEFPVATKPISSVGLASSGLVCAGLVEYGCDEVVPSLDVFYSGFCCWHELPEILDLGVDPVMQSLKILMCSRNPDHLSSRNSVVAGIYTGDVNGAKAL